MDCPTCGKQLSQAEYESTRVEQCGECSGYLVARKRLRLIKSSREKTPDVLENEAGAEQQPDTREQIRCPKCRVERMKKERVRVSADEAFMLDVCPKCENVWLDGGELARLQMKFEQSAKAIDAFARQEQLQNLDDDRREAFQQQLDELPSREHFLKGAGIDLTLLGGSVALLTATILSYLLGSRSGSATFSLVLAALLAWGVIYRFELTRNGRLAVLAIVAVAEGAYLLLPIWLLW